MEDNDELTIECNPVGRNGTAAVVVRLAGETLTAEKVDLSKPRAVGDFLDRLCDGRPGIGRLAVEAELLRLAADLAAKPEAQPDPQGLPELDAAAIVRPERFIVPEVSGLAVSSMTTVGEKVQGRWLLYLQWADGKRERQPMAAALDLPDGRRLFIHPSPSEPTPTLKPGWSAAARRRWLEGEAAPDPAEVFKAIVRANCLFPRPATGTRQRHNLDIGGLGDVDLRLSGVGRPALPLHRWPTAFRQDPSL